MLKIFYNKYFLNFQIYNKFTLFLKKVINNNLQ